MLFFINTITALFLVILGAFIRFGKAGWLIAGYNTSSKEEKAQYDKDALCTFVGNLLFVLGGITFMIGLPALLNVPNLGLIMTLGWILFAVIIIGAVIYMNTGDRFKRSK